MNKLAEQDLKNIEKMKGIQPKGDLVPDAKTAIAIAEAVLLPAYGERVIAVERPLHAISKEAYWHVYGDPTKILGGVAHVKIRKLDGAILFVGHSQ